MKRENSINKAGMLLALFLVSLVANSFTIIGVSPWVSPASADQIKNPIQGDAEATKAGKKLYKTYCSTCHGETGKGDGAAAVALNPKPAKFTDEAIQTQTDGAIYWKMTEGRAPMASYKTGLKEEQRWQLVNYIRELGKK